MPTRLFENSSRWNQAKPLRLYFLLLAFNFSAWVWAWIAFAHRPSLLATAFLAYLFGLRHAMDADHIAAIDNVVRKLMQKNIHPDSVGLYFSLGHSTVVVLATALLASAAGLSHGRMESFQRIGNVLGTSISAFFLVAIGFSNLFVLKGLWRAFRQARGRDDFQIGDLDGLLWDRGLLSRFFRPLLEGIVQSRQMYVVGVLFGLGFDTATEIGLLGIAAAQAAHGLSFAAVLAFPFLFTAGMTLVDTTDSVLMTGAYGWAFVHPLRKLWYNLTLTSLSVVMAVLVGLVESLGFMAQEGNRRGPVWLWVESLNDHFSNLGFLIVGIFMAGWLLSAWVYHLKGFERA